MKFLLFIGLVLSFNISFAKESKSVSDLTKTSFCAEYGCIPASPYVDKHGERLNFFKLSKDPLNLDLLAVLKTGDSFKRLTFKFVSGEPVVNKKALESLLKSLIGKDVSADIFEKINTAALVKTKKDALMENEAIKLESLTVRAGLILKKPTVQIDFE